MLWGVSLEWIVEAGEKYLEFDARVRGSLEKSDNAGHPFIRNAWGSHSPVDRIRVQQDSNMLKLTR